jgi:RNA polymerase sigma factor (sigma-70 family)
MFLPSSPRGISASRYPFDSDPRLPWDTAGSARHTGAFQHNAGMNTDNSDALLIALLERIAQQDDAALKVLYRQCAPKLYGLALRVVTHRDWAEDVLQEAFLSIWRSAPDYRASLSPPMAWMGLIVRSRGLDMLRRRTADRSHVTQELDDTLSDTLASDNPTPMDTAQASEQAWALHQCLGKLDNKQREVVSLAYVRDLSHGELAQQLSLPLGTVKTWIRRGLDQLRLCMARFA